MSDWPALEAELDHWRQSGIAPRLWWRDDDAQEVAPALGTLLGLSARYGTPLHLSLIPEGLHPGLAPRLNAEPTVWNLQHGLRHVNHEPKGMPSSEIGPSRDLALQRTDLAEGWAILDEAGFDRLLPGLVPPWNRLADTTRRHLPDWGYRYLSSYEGRGDDTLVPQLVQFDTHLDPIRWKYGRVFRGDAKMLDMLIALLRQRRADGPTVPIGYVTHHLQSDASIWEFTDRLLSSTQGLWWSLPDLASAG